VVAVDLDGEGKAAVARRFDLSNDEACTARLAGRGRIAADPVLRALMGVRVRPLTPLEIAELEHPFDGGAGRNIPCCSRRLPASPAGSNRVTGAGTFQLGCRARRPRGTARAPHGPGPLPFRHGGFLSTQGRRRPPSTRGCHGASRTTGTAHPLASPRRGNAHAVEALRVRFPCSPLTRWGPARAAPGLPAPS
jgi:hypothetical protein